jgi:hypothetical protein
MSEYADIYNTDYFDYPRVFVVAYQSRTFLFGAGYDEATDEYAEEFHVFLLPEMSLAQARHESGLRQRALKDLGYVPAKSVHFVGEARHWKLDIAILKQLIAADL